MAFIAIIGANSLLLSPILTDVASALNAAPFQIALAITAYNGTTALAALFLAPFIDRIGPVRAIQIAFCGFIGGTLLTGLAPLWWVVVSGQAVTGFGAGVALPAIYALAPKIAPKGEEARLVGRMLTGWSVAMVAGIPMGAFFTDHFGWRSPYLFLSFAGLAVIGVLLTQQRRLMRIEWEEDKTVTARIFHPRRIFAPFIIPSVGLLLAINFLYMSAFYGIYTYISTYLKLTNGISATTTGGIILFYGVGFGVASFLDRIVDRVGARASLLVSLLCIAGIYLLLPIPYPTIYFTHGVFFIWGLFNHFGLNCVIVLLGRAKTEKKGQIMGMNSAVTYIGGSLGSAVYGYVFSETSFVVIAVLAAGSILAASILARFLDVGETSRDEKNKQGRLIKPGSAHY